MTALFTANGSPHLVPAADIRVVATEWCRGPWDLATLHGGPVCALLATAAETRASTVDGIDLDSWLCSRLTVDILNPVPLGPIEVTTTLVKRGRRATVVDAALWVEGATEPRLAARASSQWILTGTAPSKPVPVPHPLPSRTGVSADPGGDERFDYPRPGFNVDTCDLEYVVGSHEDPGPGTSWVRFKVPVIEGRDVTPLGRVAAAADLAAAAGWDNTPTGGNYINPDVTLQLVRAPVGEWLALEALTVHGDGSALLEARCFDDEGYVGRVSQSLVEAPIRL